jgi:XapX domain-containing protein
MKAYTLSFLVGCVVGVLYAGVRVRGPAPPLVALLGLLGMLAGEHGLPMLKMWFHS